MSYTNEELVIHVHNGCDSRYACAQCNEIVRRLRLLDRQEWRCGSCGGVVRFDGTKPPESPAYRSGLNAAGWGGVL